MYNPFKEMMDNRFFNNFLKASTKVLEIENKEEVYYQPNKLAVVVKDEEVGRQIFNIVTNLKNRAIKICTTNTTFEIFKFTSDEENRIEKFYINFTFDENWKAPTLTEKLQELVKFIEVMSQNGYVIDTSKFSNEECNCISSLLSFFVEAEGTMGNSDEYLIKFIHYALSDGKDLHEYYEELVSKGICSLDDIPYCLPVIQMCYQYFSTGIYFGDIYMVLQDESLEESFGTHYYKYLMFDKNNFESVFHVVKTDDEYKIYSDNIKIYNKIPQELENFIRNNIAKDNSIEQIDGIIINLNEKIIGYKFYTNEIPNSSLVTEPEFSKQIEIFSFISMLNKYLNKVTSFKVDLNIAQKDTDFSIEESVIYFRNNYGIDSFVIVDNNELFKLISSDEEYVKSQIVSVFFKIYLKYLEKNYGKMSDEDAYFEKDEVRYLNPILAREFVNFALAKQTDYSKAQVELFDFLYTSKSTANQKHLYDRDFIYNPEDIPATFDYEVEKKYGIKMKKLLLSDFEKQLPDGRRLFAFSRKRDISEIKELEKSNLAEINSYFSDLTDDKIKIVGLSEIIYSKTINSDGMYDVKGYITTPIFGNPLTSEFLSSLSNKDFLKITAYLLLKFDKSRYNISLESIYMDDNFNFYVNIFDKGFEINELSTWDSDRYIAHTIFKLKRSNCNPHMFVDIEDEEHYSKKKLLAKANAMDEYCSKHKIYFNSFNEMCPICLKTMYPISNTVFEENQIVYEDKYAKHYRLKNSEYFIKVYNSSNVDMSVLENHVDLLITEKLYQYKAIQEGFIPVKKAVDKDKNFIGYLYKPMGFDNKDICMNITDLQNMNNLIRLKSLIRLVTQVNEITSSGFMFIENPFENVFLNRDLKRQVQIVNVDFISTRGSLEETKKWTSQYVYKILDLDKSLDIDLKRKTSNLEILLNSMKRLESQLTKYCYTHKIYYKSDYLFCPRCIDLDTLPKIDIIEKSKSDFEGIKSMTEGGEAHIYAYEDSSVVKVFKEGKNHDKDFKNQILVKLLKKKAILEKIDESNHRFRYIVPNALFVDDDSKEIYGYKMDMVEGTPICNLRDKVEINNLGFTKKDVLEIMITVGEGIQALHDEANMYIGDLNGRNILFDKNKNVYFLDFDGMGIDEIQPEFCTDEYIDPVSKNNKNITKNDDWYSLAVQVFHYLTFTHPFNGIYSVNEYGRKVMLGITEKMERRISLLGKHGIEVPAIAEDWKWMDKEFKNVLLEIFEKELRVSIVPYMKKQYEILYGHEPFDTIVTTKIKSDLIRINPKFVAKPIKPFSYNIAKLLNPYVAICSDGNNFFVSIHGKTKIWGKVNLPKCHMIKDILLSDSEDMAFVIYPSYVLVHDLVKNIAIYKKEISNTDHIVVNDKTFYFLDPEVDQYSIFKRDCSSSTIQKEKIRTSSLHYLSEFYVESNSKFITINDLKEVYCNDEQYYQFDDIYELLKFKILYDNISKSWLIMSDEGKGIVINSRGSLEEFDLELSDWNLDNISYINGDIYIPSEKSLYIISTRNKLAVKKMECDEIITPNSKVYDASNSGFYIMNNVDENTLYEVSKG